MPLKQRTKRARQLRREMTEAEKRLWKELRVLDLPIRFRRQHPIGKRIVDFACPAVNLAIELDGGQHAVRTESDEERSLEIGRYGYRVVRFWNGDVMQNLAGVLEQIRRKLDVSLSALGRGEGRGEVGGAWDATGAAHLTLPVAHAPGPLPLRPKGRRGHGHA
jgi:very-short-patch-repair endonuclease